MNTKDDGGPAFPGGVNTVYTNMDQGCPTQEGMTLRDYFAAKAMQGLLANAELLKSVASRIAPNQVATVYAGMSLEYADAMLAARNGGGKP